MEAVARIGRVPRINPVVFDLDHRMEDEFGQPTTWDDGPPCTEFVMVPWPNKFTEWCDNQPLLLLRGWQFYIHEHALRKGQDARRIGYVANKWLEVMGPDSTPETWKHADLDRFEDVRRAEGVVGPTIRHNFAIQRACLSHNFARERLTRMPHFEKPEGKSKVRRPLTEEEFRRLMRSPLEYRIRMFFIMAYHTGHRSRAIETLPWARVNLEDRYINFNDPAMRETKKRRRDGFPISDELYPRLVAAFNKPGRDELVIGRSPRGDVSSTYHKCKAALRAVGIDEEGIARHTLRKTYCTERIKAGHEPEKIALSINENPATMRRNYVVLLAEDLRETVNLRRAV